MSKNPFVNCKSRKRRKKVVINRARTKEYCPRTMVRFNETLHGTVWVCKMCLKCVLKEEAVPGHISRCNAASLNSPTAPELKNVEDMRYICEYCNRVFSRKVALKKHMELHEKSTSNQESGESDEESKEELENVDPPTPIEPNETTT